MILNIIMGGVAGQGFGSFKSFADKLMGNVIPDGTTKSAGDTFNNSNTNIDNTTYSTYSNTNLSNINNLE